MFKPLTITKVTFRAEGCNDSTRYFLGSINEVGDQLKRAAKIRKLFVEGSNPIRLEKMVDPLLVEVPDA